MFSHRNQQAQGLIEYALILVLVAVVTIAILSLLGKDIQVVFCNIVVEMQQGEGQCTELPPDDSSPNQVVITQAKYNNAQQRIQLKATYNGGYDASVTLTASPGGIMTQQGNQYALTINGITGCPCNVTITASSGETATKTSD